MEEEEEEEEEKNLLLGNNHEISSYTIAVLKQWLCKQRPLLDNDHNRHPCYNRIAVGSGVLCVVRPKAV
jgi:hypothetical protein